jgi:hypothetical protein
MLQRRSFASQLLLMGCWSDGDKFRQQKLSYLSFPTVSRLWVALANPTVFFRIGPTAAASWICQPDVGDVHPQFLLNFLKINELIQSLQPKKMT